MLVILHVTLFTFYNNKAKAQTFHFSVGLEQDENFRSRALDVVDLLESFCKVLERPPTDSREAT